MFALDVDIENCARGMIHRYGWEYWEAHNLLGWPFLRRVCYSPVSVSTAVPLFFPSHKMVTCWVADTALRLPGGADSVDL